MCVVPHSRWRFQCLALNQGSPETRPNKRVHLRHKERDEDKMGAAASIDATAVPGIKEEYEKKKAEGR